MPRVFSCYHRAELLLWLGALRRGIHAEQQPDDRGRIPDRSLRSHPLLHHVCRHEQVSFLLLFQHFFFIIRDGQDIRSFCIRYPTE